MAKTVVKISVVRVYNTNTPHDSQLCMTNIVAFMRNSHAHSCGLPVASSTHNDQLLHMLKNYHGLHRNSCEFLRLYTLCVNTKAMPRTN